MKVKVKKLHPLCKARGFHQWSGQPDDNVVCVTCGEPAKAWALQRARGHMSVRKRTTKPDERCPASTEGHRHLWVHNKAGPGFRCKRCDAVEELPWTKSASQIRTLLKRDGYLCWLCEARFTPDNPPTRDHVVPRSRGGSNDLGNLKLACAPCNGERGAAYHEIEGLGGVTYTVRGESEPEWRWPWPIGDEATA